MFPLVSLGIEGTMSACISSYLKKPGGLAIPELMGWGFPRSNWHKNSAPGEKCCTSNEVAFAHSLIKCPFAGLVYKYSH